MNALTPPHLEKLLALALAHAEALERERTALNLRVLELETQRDCLMDERDAAIARAQGASHGCSSKLRHEAMQCSVELLDFAHSLKATGRPVKAAAAEARSRKLVEALR